MNTAALKRELALLRSSLAALKPSQQAGLGDPIAWAERTAGLTLDPWQRDVLLSDAPRLLLNANALYRQEYFGPFVSARVFDAKVLAHMFGNHTEEEPERAVSIVERRIADRFLQ